MKHQAVLCRANQHQIFSAAQDKLSQRDFAGLRHGVRQQTIGLLAALVGAEVIALFVVDRIHLRKRHELGNLDGLGCLAFERFEFFVGNFDVLVFSELVSFDQAFALHDFVAYRTEALLPDPIAALGVE